MSTLLILPVLIPLLSATLGLVVSRWQRAQAAVGVAGSVALLAAAVALLQAVNRHGVLAATMGSWPAPMGITLVADTLAALMVLLAAVTGLAVAVYALSDIDRPRRQAGFYPLLHGLLLGVCCAFITGDAFNLYVCFEIMLMASFVLLALGGERPQMEGALKYVALNLISSAVFLTALGVLYGLTGTLNLAHLAVAVPAAAETHPALVTALAGLFLVSFGIKAGLFPLYAWLPASYHTPPVAVSAVFAGLLTKVGVYALLRMFTLVFPGQQSSLQLLLVLSVATMLMGVLGAVAQYHLRRVLSFHIISQIGYMVAGLGLLAVDDPAVRRLGLLAAVFYIAHHIIVKTNLFLIGGLIARLGGSEQLRQSGGLYPPPHVAGGALPGAGPEPGGHSTAVRVLGQAGGVPRRPGGRGLAGGGRGRGRRRAHPHEHDQDLERGLLEGCSGRPAKADVHRRPALAGHTGGRPGGDHRGHRPGAGLVAGPGRPGGGRVAGPDGIPASRRRLVRGRHAMKILGLNAIMAVVWAALQGRIDLANLLVGYLLGYGRALAGATGPGPQRLLQQAARGPRLRAVLRPRTGGLQPAGGLGRGHAARPAPPGRGGRAPGPWSRTPPSPCWPTSSR